MISINKKEIESCCGNKSSVWILNLPINKEHITFFTDLNFKCYNSYTNKGMLYAESSCLIVSGVFGLNELRIKCKVKDCTESIKLLEEAILNIK